MMSWGHPTLRLAAFEVVDVGAELVVTVGKVAVEKEEEAEAEAEGGRLVEAKEMETLVLARLQNCCARDSVEESVNGSGQSFAMQPTIESANL